MRAHDVEMLTIGQYLQPSGGHLPVLRCVHPDTFKMFETEALKMGFKNAACGPMVRSELLGQPAGARGRGGSDHGRGGVGSFRRSSCAASPLPACRWPGIERFRMAERTLTVKGLA